MATRGLPSNRLPPTSKPPQSPKGIPRPVISDSKNVIGRASSSPRSSHPPLNQKPTPPTNPFHTKPKLSPPFSAQKSPPKTFNQTGNQRPPPPLSPKLPASLPLKSLSNRLSPKTNSAGEGEPPPPKFLPRSHSDKANYSFIHNKHETTPSIEIGANVLLALSNEAKDDPKLKPKPPTKPPLPSTAPISIIKKISTSKPNPPFKQSPTGRSPPYSELLVDEDTDVGDIDGPAVDSNLNNDRLNVQILQHLRKYSDMIDADVKAAGSPNEGKSEKKQIEATRKRAITLEKTKKLVEVSPSLSNLPQESLIHVTSALDEILSTEQTYVHNIEILHRIFWLRLTKSNSLNIDPILEPEHISSIFSNIPAIYELNKKFLSELQVIERRNTLLLDVGQLFLQFMPFFKLYTEYVQHYDEAIRISNLQREKNKKYDRFLHLQEECEGQTLESFLIMPVQRVPRYSLLLAEICKYLPEDSGEAPQLREALKAVRGIADYINTSFKESEARSRVVVIREHFKGDVNIIAPGRYHIRDGLLEKLYSRPEKHMKMGEELHFFLFNDILVYAQTALDGRFAHRRTLDIKGMIVENLGDSEKYRNAFAIRTAQKSIICSAPSLADKHSWIEDLNKQIEKIAANAQTLKTAQGQDNQVLGESVAPVWVSDADATSCMCCRKEFGVLSFKHHCRICGHVICGNCSTHRMILPSQGPSPVRVCDPCFAKANPNGLAPIPQPQGVTAITSALLFEGDGMDSSRNIKNVSDPNKPSTNQPMDSVRMKIPGTDDVSNSTTLYKQSAFFAHLHSSLQQRKKGLK